MFSASIVEQKNVASVLRRAQMCFTGFYDKFLLKIIRFFNTTSKTCQLSLPFSVMNFKMTSTGGNPWPKFPRDKPFGRFAAFSDSWGIWLKSNFT